MIDFIKFLLGIYISLFYRVELVNINKVPQKGSAIICANHIGELDMFFMGYKLKRLIHYMAKDELFRIPLLSSLLRWLGAFPVKRGKGDVGAIKTALRILEEGNILGIFPEGTRTHGKDARNVKVKNGAAMIAINAGVPIIPVGIRRDCKLFGSVRVVFGEPFYIDALKDKKYSNEELSEISLGIMKKIYALADR